MDSSMKREAHILQQKEKVSLIYTWASYHPGFDISFTFRMKRQLEAGTKLTDNQEASLDNTIRRWKINGSS